MALDADALVVPGTGQILFNKAAATGTAPVIPDDIMGTLPAGWEILGHTSYENGVTFTSEGGEQSVLPTWQAPAGARVSTTPESKIIKFNAHQVDNNVLEFYFGTGTAADGTYSVSKTAGGSGVEAQLYIRMIDSNHEGDHVDWYFPRVNIKRADDIEVDPEGILEFPLQATVLDAGASAYLFQILDDTIEAPA